MKEIIINQDIQLLRVDKVCHKVFKAVPSSFIYKMFRKKNIVLNNKKIEGNEIVKLGDSLKFYFSDESFDKLAQSVDTENQTFSGKGLDTTLIIYEDDNVLVYNKPTDVLSQPNGENLNLVDLYKSTLLHRNHEVTIYDSFGVCNRLDRNTTGVTLIGKNPSSLKALNNGIKDRKVIKKYHGIVNGIVLQPMHLSSHLEKDSESNKAILYDKPTKNSVYIETDIIPLKVSEFLNISLVEITLHTGKTHQIRAHLSSVGHPIIGDAKYGDNRVNMKFRKDYGIVYQMLHSHDYTFQSLDEPLTYLEQHTFRAPYFKHMKDLILKF